MRGILTFYINFLSEDSQEERIQTMKTAKEFNKEMIQRIEKEENYIVMFVPTSNESSRIEVTHWDKPCHSSGMNVVLNEEANNG